MDKPPAGQRAYEATKKELALLHKVARRRGMIENDTMKLAAANIYEHERPDNA